MDDQLSALLAEGVVAADSPSTPPPTAPGATKASASTAATGSSSLFAPRDRSADTADDNIESSPFLESVDLTSAASDDEPREKPMQVDAGGNDAASSAQQSGAEGEGAPASPVLPPPTPVRRRMEALAEERKRSTDLLSDEADDMVAQIMRAAGSDCGSLSGVLSSGALPAGGAGSHSPAAGSTASVAGAASATDGDATTQHGAGGGKGDDSARSSAMMQQPPQQVPVGMEGLLPEGMPMGGDGALGGTVPVVCVIIVAFQGKISWGWRFQGL